jgi:hypothetical protein
MRRSKVIVSVPGAGIDTLRFWEAMGFGAVLVSAEISKQLYVRDLPEPHRHALYFDSWAGMQSLLEEIVKAGDWWQQIRRAADQFIQCRHSTRARATQLIQLFKEVG